MHAVLVPVVRHVSLLLDSDVLHLAVGRSVGLFHTLSAGSCPSCAARVHLICFSTGSWSDGLVFAPPDGGAAMAPSMLRWCLGTSFSDIFWHLGTIVAWPVLAQPAVGGTVAMATVTGEPGVIVGFMGGTFEG